MKKTLLLTAVATMLLANATIASAQGARDLKFYDVRELGLPILNQGFDDCVRSNASAQKDAKIKGATEYDANMQKPADKADAAVKENGPVNDGYYTRLSSRVEGKVRQAVWDLGQNSTGIAVRFRSNAKNIGVKWTLLANFRMNHMAPSGICGIDLYAYEDGQWLFVGTAQPNGKESVNFIRRNMDGKMRDFVMFLPLYDGVIDLAIGVEEGAKVEKPSKLGENGFGGSATKPLVFYGTSVTQGGCASRPGMVHTNILSRMLKRECVNLGFSGNGRMDFIMAEEISRIDAGAYIIDCLGNMTYQMVKDSTQAFIRKLASEHPTTPVIMVSNYPYQYQWIDKGTQDEVDREDEQWKAYYNQLKEEGFTNLRYVDIGGTHSHKNPMEGAATGPDNEAAVDGTHLTDLGFMRLAKFFYPILKIIE